MANQFNIFSIENNKIDWKPFLHFWSHNLTIFYVSRYRYIRLQQLIMYIKTYTLMTHLFYIFIVITLQLFIASYLMANFHLILNYQIPQTLVKLLREFDKKTSEKEVELVSIMHRTFSCCHYQTPYQFGDLKPSECDQNQGCLRPIQVRFQLLIIHWYSYRISLLGFIFLQRNSHGSICMCQ